MVGFIQHWVIDQVRDHSAFVTHRNDPGGPIGWLANYTEWKAVSRATILGVEFLTVDAILVSPDAMSHTNNCC
jgi:hypothetical protein